MRVWARLRGQWRALWRGSRQEAEMEAEMRFHREAYGAELMARGVAPGEAARRAQIEFGGSERAKEECREARGASGLEAVRQDTRFALRMLRKNRGYAAAAVVTLALGIGACAAVFTLVQSILLQPAPIRDASRVVVVWLNHPAEHVRREGPSGLDYLDWRERNRSFADLLLFEHGTGTLTGGGEPEQVAGLRVTPNFSDFFGLPPIVGHTFGPAEAASQHNVALLAERYWREHYGGDPRIAGRALTLNGEAYTVIGVLPARFNTVFNADIVVPFDNAWVRRADGDLGVLGRLRPGVSLHQASAEMTGVMRHMDAERPERHGAGAVLVPIDTVRAEAIRPALLLLEGAVGLVLLIACANVVSLMLGRAVTRRREFAVRRALGATRGRLARQCLAESAILASLGGLAGWGVAQAALRLLTARLPAYLPVPDGADKVPLPPIHMGGAVVAFTIGLALLTAAVGLAPAFAGAGDDVQQALKAGGREVSANPRAARARGRFVVAECGLALVLAVCAGQMLAGFAGMMASNPGFRADHLVTLRLKLANDAPSSPYRDPARQAAAYEAFQRAAERVPGVEKAGLTSIIPMSQDDMDRESFTVQEAAPLPPGVRNSADIRTISPGFLGAMGIPLLRGRTFAESDNSGRAGVALIDATLAQRFFPGQNPIGKHVQAASTTSPAREIVGVVGAVRDLGFDREPNPTLYLPMAQSPRQSMSLVVRTGLPTSTMVAELKTAIHGVDPNQPVFSPRTMDDIIGGTVSAQRVALGLLGAFAALALALTVSGIYGVTAYAVSQRTQELGIRMALGARPAAVLELVLRHGVGLALRGAAWGVVGAVLAVRLLRHQFYGFGNAGTATLAEMLGAGVALLTLVALAACYLPARRAMRLDPLASLRHE